MGGFVREYQVDVDPDAMRIHGVTLADVFRSVRMSNVDVGARTIEINRAEYVVRGLGFLESVEDLEETVVQVRDDIPLRIADVAKVSLGPALRRGVLDKGGAEAVGGVVVVRYGENPLKAIENIHAKIAEISAGLPEKVLDDGTVSRVTIVPFYDRSGLIRETLGTLNTAISQQVLVTVLVVLVMVGHLATSLLISSVLPLAILFAFIAMRLFGGRREHRRALGESRSRSAPSWTWASSCPRTSSGTSGSPERTSGASTSSSVPRRRSAARC